MSNYQANMAISLVMAKLYSHIIEQKISSLVENHHKEAFGQMVFKLKHSIVDYLITLREFTTLLYQGVNFGKE